MDFKQEHLVQARPWRKAVFTTYALSLSFFESVVLDGLVRGRTAETLILADAEGVRAGLSEQGAQRAGRDYELEPVVVDRGVFHPKISVFADKDDGHLIVGSGNLTFSGWGGNFEIAEHLHPSFAADAFDDAAMFFMLMSDSPGVAHGAGDRCAALANDLTAIAGRHARNGGVRLLHSLDGSIADRIAGYANELGGATRLTVVSPFWDSGAAVGRLCESLGLGEVHVHAHQGGTVRGQAGANWPSAMGIDVVAETVSDFDARSGSLLHAKAFEVMCRRGRVLVSGSANATAAALHSGNVEAVVARIQREKLLGWTLEDAAVPLPLPPLAADDKEKVGRAGVLRAEIVGDAIKGTVLSPQMAGEANVFHRTSEGDVLLGETTVGADGSFSATVPGFELAAIRGGRVVLRIERGEQASEGFASLSTLAGLRRIAGKSAASLLAVLSGTETPEDVRALMEWAQDNPGMLVPAFGNGGGGGGGHAAERPSDILAADLWRTKEADPDGGGPNGTAGGGRSYARFVDALLAAMKERRGTAVPREDDEDGEGAKDGADAAKETARQARDSLKAMEAFMLVFDAMLPDGAPRAAVLRAFDLAAYVCDRLQASVTQDMAREWLRRLVDAFFANGPADERRETAIAAAMALCGSAPDREALRATRSRVRMAGGEFGGPYPGYGEADPFRAIMGDEAPLDDAWRRAGETRTWREQARSYCDALEGEGTVDGFDELLSALPSEAGTMAAALANGNANGHVIRLGHWQATCNCHMQLPRMEQGKLKAFGVARALNCCQRVLVWPEERADG